MAGEAQLRFRGRLCQGPVTQSIRHSAQPNLAYCIPCGANGTDSQIIGRELGILPVDGGGDVVQDASFPKERSSLCPFVIQKPAFSFHAAPIAGEGTVGADHAMTRHHNADWIGTVGQTHCADRGGSSYPLCQLAVRFRRAARYLSQGIPHRTLKGSTGRFYRQVIDRSPISRERGLYWQRHMALG